MEYKLKDAVKSANTGADAIQRAPIVEYDTGVKCLRIGDISNKRKYVDWGFTNVNEDNYKRYKIRKGNIIVARTGSTVGINKYINNEYDSVYNNGLIRLEIDELNYNSKFIYYTMQTQNFKNYIKGIAFGTTGQPNIQINDLLDFKFNYIPLEIQNKIVKIISKLDKKIELNDQMNENLLNLGKTLLSKINFDNLITLKEVALIISKGTTPTGNDMNEFPDRSIKYIKVRDFGEYGINEKDIEYIPTEIHNGKLKRSILKKDDLLVSIAGTLGKIAIVNESLNNANTNQAVAFIRLINNYKKGYLYFYMNMEEFQDEIVKRQVHAVQPNLSLTELGNIKIPNLEENETMIFNDLLNKIQSNNEENKKLEQLRDTLLPKLMNGEINLDKIEI